MDRHVVELIRGAAAGFVARLTASLCVFLFGVWIARLLGAEDSGLFYLGLAVVSVPAVMCRVGLDGSVVRFVAAHLSRGEPLSAGAIYRRSVAVVALLATGAGILVWLLAESLAVQVFTKPELAQVLRFFAWVLVPVPLFMLHGQFLQAEKHIASAVFSQTGLLPLLSMALLLVYGEQSGLQVVINVYAVAAWLTLLFTAVWYHRQRSYPAFSHSAHPGNSHDFSQLVASARSLAVSDLVNKVVQPWAPILLLGAWSSADQVGLFGAANRLAALVAFATMPVNRILAPKMSALWAAGDREGFARIAKQATLIMLVVSIPIGMVLVMIPERLMRVFGEEFMAAAAALVVLSLAQIVNALTGPVRSMLIMSGNEKYHRLSSALGGLALLALGFALIPRYGSLGAALAAGAGLLVNNGSAAVLVWMRLGVAPLLWK